MDGLKMQNGLKKKTIFLISLPLVLGVLIALAYFLAQDRKRSSALSNSQSPATQVLRAAPEFELPDPSGALHRLKDLKGTPIVLHFWASWCPPCLSEISNWVELASTYHDRPIQWVAISLDQNWDDALKVWTLSQSQGRGGKIISLLDVGGGVSDQYGTFQFPETYLLNSDLKIIMKWVGPQNWDGEEIRRLLDHWIEKKTQASMD
jgi:peroxiredoxin